MAVDKEFLRRLSLFRELPEDDLTAVSQRLAERRFERGQTVFAEDETGQTMYIVRAGLVKASRWLPSGREVILALHPAGDYFGEMGLIDGKTTPATITAVEPSQILTLDRSGFLELLRRHSFAMALLRELCGRCRDGWKQVETLTYHTADARVRVALRQLCDREGVQTPDGVRIDFPLTHRDLASMAGVSRETVTRVLGHLVQADLVKTVDRRFVVRDPEALTESDALE
jgi:CRP/FNR family cyclic AMP-dependent transcriptional regulator